MRDLSRRSRRSGKRPLPACPRAIPPGPTSLLVVIAERTRRLEFALVGLQPRGLDVLAPAIVGLLVMMIFRFQNVRVLARAKLTGSAFKARGFLVSVNLIEQQIAHGGAMPDRTANCCRPSSDALR